jgi:hypothetical protein
MSKKTVINEIASRILDINSLKPQNSDSTDFKELALWKIEQALELAYEKGKEEERVSKKFRHLGK